MNTFTIQLPDIPPHKRLPNLGLPSTDDRIEMLTNAVDTYRQKLYEAEWLIGQMDIRIANETNRIQTASRQSVAEAKRLSVENTELRRVIRAKEKDLASAGEQNAMLIEENRFLRKENRRMEGAIATLLQGESERVKEAVTYVSRESEQREQELKQQLAQVTQMYHASLLLCLSVGTNPTDDSMHQ